MRSQNRFKVIMLVATNIGKSARPKLVVLCISKESANREQTYDAIKIEQIDVISD